MKNCLKINGKEAFFYQSFKKSFFKTWVVHEKLITILRKLIILYGGEWGENKNVIPKTQFHHLKAFLSVFSPCINAFNPKMLKTWEYQKASKHNRNQIEIVCSVPCGIYTV